MTAWVRYKDATGSGLDLLPQIKSAVTSQGYELIGSSKEADYQLMVTLQHFDKADSFDGGDSALKIVQKIAPLAGAAAGYGAGGDSTAGKVGGAVVGFGVGSLASAAMENHQKVAEWDLVLDLQVNENMGRTFTEEWGGSSENKVSNASLQGAGGQAHQGSRSADQSRQASLTREKTHWKTTGRMIAIAYQMKMTREEALDALLGRLPGAIAGALP